jgi:hypothetical protein
MTVSYDLMSCATQLLEDTAVIGYSSRPAAWMSHTGHMLLALKVAFSRTVVCCIRALDALIVEAAQHPQDDGPQQPSTAGSSDSNSRCEGQLPADQQRQEQEHIKPVRALHLVAQLLHLEYQINEEVEVFIVCGEDWGMLHALSTLALRAAVVLTCYSPQFTEADKDHLALLLGGKHALIHNSAGTVSAGSTAETTAPLPQHLAGLEEGLTAFTSDLTLSLLTSPPAYLAALTSLLQAAVTGSRGQVCVTGADIHVPITQALAQALGAGRVPHLAALYEGWTAEGSQHLKDVQQRVGSITQQPEDDVCRLTEELMSLVKRVVQRHYRQQPL